MSGAYKSALGYVSLLFSPVSLLVGIITLIYLFSDYSERLTIDSPTSKSLEGAQQYNVDTDLLLDSETREQIINLYKAMAPEEEEKSASKKSEQLTLEQQLAQSGELKKVYVDNTLIELKAVIAENRSNDIDVLLQITDMETGSSNIQRVKNNDQILGFDLKVNSQISVALTRNTELGKQDINLVMYKKAINDK